jgi:hypothetical protein
MRYGHYGRTKSRPVMANKRRDAMQAKFLTPLIVALTLAPAAVVLAADQAAPAAAPAKAAAAPPAEAAAGAPAEEAGLKLSATLNGTNEVGGGDKDGTGSFAARMAKGQLCYTLTTANIDEATMAHIHTGAAGVNGPVYIGLPDLDAGEHCQDIDGERAAALKSKPEGYYVNVHNGDFPGGAIRGQLTKN